MKWSIVFFFFFFYNCTDPVREAAILDELIEKGVADYKQEKKAACYAEALKEADRLVDSIFLSKAFYTKQDTFIKPMKPNRPQDPIPWDERDDRYVAPLFDSLVQDSGLLEPMDR